MRYILLALIAIFVVGCSSKTIVKKQNPSVEMQKQDAQKAWKDLDKE
ncbi:hypothetical protein [Caminibacter pacificus]|uniref:Lipoprotein n=1 Tax=Caminibacter pacificus TaxID=1424653 RepID=A0AAJ4UX08_9BACT|nr:hypothetical protein [Caminibacter pacificus]ROR38811.1 hypothetical protein EDC58_1725 [Caminibacter pacificus]